VTHPPTRPNAKSVAELVGRALDPIAKKRGLARAELIAWWPDIVGTAYSGRTAPERIRWARDGKPATLVVRCDPSVALPFAHETSRVRERVNTYFGYPAVGAVRIVQQPVGGELEKKPAPTSPRELSPALAGKLDRIDGPLRDSLEKLGKSILART
jgi:hypothetical protein